MTQFRRYFTKGINKFSGIGTMGGQIRISAWQMLILAAALLARPNAAVAQVFSTEEAPVWQMIHFNGTQRSGFVSARDADQLLSVGDDEGDLFIFIFEKQFTFDGNQRNAFYIKSKRVVGGKTYVGWNDSNYLLVDDGSKQLFTAILDNTGEVYLRRVNAEGTGLEGGGWSVNDAYQITNEGLATENHPHEQLEFLSIPFTVHFTRNDNGDIYLQDMGNGNILQSKKQATTTDDTNAQTWYKVNEQDGSFLLRSKRGNYVYNDGGTFKSTNNVTTATRLYPVWQQDQNGFTLKLTDGTAKSDDAMNPSGGSNDGAQIKTFNYNDAGSRLEFIGNAPKDGNVFQLRFTSGNINNLGNNYITDFGSAGSALRTSRGNWENSQWRLVFTDANKLKFKIQSKEGNYVLRDGGVYKTTAKDAEASVFTFKPQNSGAVQIGVDNQDGGMNPWGGAGTLGRNIQNAVNDAGNNLEIIALTPQNSTYYRLRFTDGATSGTGIITNNHLTANGNGEEAGLTTNGRNGNFFLTWRMEQQGDGTFRLRGMTGYLYYNGSKFITDDTNATSFTPKKDDEGKIQLTFESGGTKYLAKNGTGLIASTNANQDANFIEFIYEPWQYVNDFSDKDIKHKISYLAGVTGTGYPDAEFQNAEDGWTITHEGATIQKVSTFEIDRYVKQGQTVTLIMPTSVWGSVWGNSHRAYQRWYNYATEGNLDMRYITLDKEQLLWGYQYKNGYVVGTALNHCENSDRYHVPYVVDAQLPLGETSLDIAVDMSRYGDLSYDASNVLTEPSLTLRTIWHLKDANEMADVLKTKTGDDWLEESEIHFPSTSVNLEPDRIGLEHEFSNYWIPNGAGPDIINIDRRDRIEVVLEDPNGTGIYLGGGGYITDDKTGDGIYRYIKGATLYHAASDALKAENFGRSRFIEFIYPQTGTIGAGSTGTVKATGEDNPAIIKVYAVDENKKKYNLAKFTLIFDEGCATLPATAPAVSSGKRSAASLKARTKDGTAEAKITFDIGNAPDYTTPSSGITYHDRKPKNPNTTYANSSALPLLFSSTNYAFDGGNNGGNWNDYSSYSLITTMTAWGNVTYDAVTTDLAAEANMRKAFIYIDASESAGRVASVPFEGTFCQGSRLMCTGWITSRNHSEGGREVNTGNVENGTIAPGSVMLTVKGKSGGTTEPIYKFCPGQILGDYRKEDGTVEFPSNGSPGVWQQFYFEFTPKKAYTSYVLEIDNNCVASYGGDYMLDDICVYSEQPEITPEMVTPLCGSELSLLRLTADFNALLTTSGTTEILSQEYATVIETTKPTVSIVFLDKEKLYKAKGGSYVDANGNAVLTQPYPPSVTQSEFEAALVGTVKNTINGAGSAYSRYDWSAYFENSSQPEYNFTNAVGAQKDSEGNSIEPSRTYRDKDGSNRILVFNGNLNKLTYEEGKTYCLLYTNQIFTTENINQACDLFYNSSCAKRTEFKINSRLKLRTDDTVDAVGEEYQMCAGVAATVTLDMEGLDEEGQPVKMSSLNYDWWLGSTISGTFYPGTLNNFNNVDFGSGIKLSNAMSLFRRFNETSTEEQVINGNVSTNEDFTPIMLALIQKLVAAGDLMIGRPSFVLPGDLSRGAQENGIVKTDGTEAQNALANRYLFFVAAPIEDDNLRSEKDGVTYFCNAPQGLFVHLKENAPKMLAGYANRSYPGEIDNQMLSVRIAKSQFMKVSNITPGGGNKKLHLRVRGVTVESTGAKYVTKRGEGSGGTSHIYLMQTDDQNMQQKVDEALQNAEGERGLAVGDILDLVAYPGSDLTKNKLSVQFNNVFEVREGYEYELKVPFKENTGLACPGAMRILLKIVPDYEVWTGDESSTEWNKDDNWRRADWDELQAGNSQNMGDKRLFSNNTNDAKYYMTNAVNYLTDLQRERRKGFAPLYCTRLLVLKGNTETDIMKKRRVTGPILYSPIPYTDGFPSLSTDASPLLKYDFQTHEYSDVSTDDQMGITADDEDLVVEDYNANVCDQIVFQPRTEMVNAHYLSYNKAWVELEVPKNDWQLLASPLKGMLSGEWYAPTGNARQETTYFEDVTFNTTDYDRYSPAVYQRSWDKAKAVLYEPGAAWSNTDGVQRADGDTMPGTWIVNNNDTTKYDFTPGEEADEYLQRITYKPFGQNKANVAVKGMWSNVFNDHSVKYDDGGFSVMVINYFKDGTTGHYTDKEDEKAAVFRLPKEDQYYDIWNWGQTTTEANRVRVYIKDDEHGWPDGTTTGIDLTGKRWKLRSDDLSTNTSFNMTMKNEGDGSLGKFLVANPFICGLDVSKLIAETANSGKVNTEVTIPTKNGDEVYSYDSDNSQWQLNNGTAATPIVEPGKAFWMTVPSTAADQNSLTLSFTADIMTPAYTADGNGGSSASGSDNGARPYSDTEPTALVITAERNHKRSSAVVSLGDGVQNEFVENEDVATFIDENRMSVPTIYTLCGRLATTVNRIQDFCVLPIGIESNDDAACTVTFRGVETISADGLQLYDAVAQTQTPITSGTTVTLPGQTQNRFFLLGGTRTAIEAAEATHLQIFTEGRTVQVISSTTKPIRNVRVFDTAGRLLHTANPQAADFSFDLPAAGIYIVDAQTEADRKTQKVMVR